MKFVLTPMGSAGDVHPLVWLAKLLAHRGQRVVMIAQEMVAEIPERAGIETVRIGNAAEQEGVIRHPDLWHPRRGFDLLARWAPTWAREGMGAIKKEIVAGETVLVGGALAFGARIVSEAADVPLVTVHLQPTVFMSAEEMPVPAAGMEWVRGAPRWMRRALMSVVHRGVDQRLKRPLNRLRREAGVVVPIPRGVMREWWHSPDGIVCLFPEWYAGKAKDWPAQAVLTRFPLYDESGVQPVEEGLQQFLSAGEKPVVITPGSANAQAGRFLNRAVEGVLQSGRRALVLTRFPEQVMAPPQGSHPPTVHVCAYAPFSQVFPRAAAVVHHGGIGTTAQCFAAGVPQLIMPMSHDQPDNAARVKKLGVGEYVYPKRFTAERVAERLGALLNSPAVGSACAGMRERMKAQMSAEEVAGIVLEMSERALRVRQINGAGVFAPENVDEVGGEGRKGP